MTRSNAHKIGKFLKTFLNVYVPMTIDNFGRKIMYDVWC